MRIPSGKTDQLIFFVAVDATDLKTRETGLSSFTVYRSRNGGTATAYTTPTITELSAANMPGVYALTVDEDTTIASASDSEEYCVHITQASMAPVTRTIELYRRDTTSGNTASVDSNGRVDVIKVAGTTQTAGDLAAMITAVDDYVDTEVAAIKAKTDNLPSDPADASDISTSFTSVLSKMLKYTQLLARKDAAIATDNATELTAINADGGSGAGAYANTTDALEAVRDNMGTAQTGDSYARLGAPAGASIAADIAGVQSDTNDLQTRVPAALVAGRIDASVGAMAANTVTASAVAADAVTEIQSGLSTLDAAGIRTAVGLASANLDTQLTAIDDYLDTEIASIISTLSTIAGYIDTEVAAIKTVTDQLVAAQSEPTGVPAANATPLAKIAWIAALARNKITQTSTTQTLRNDADSGDIATSTHSDDGTTHTRGEWA